MASKNNIDLNSKCTNYNNVSQGLIHITDDKLEVILLKHDKKNRQYYSWTTPFSIFISCFVALLTSDFKGISINETQIVKPEFFQAFFFLVTLISFILTIYTSFKAYKNRDGITIDNLINKIKNSQQETI